VAARKSETRLYEMGNHRGLPLQFPQITQVFLLFGCGSAALYYFRVISEIFIKQKNIPPTLTLPLERLCRNWVKGLEV
jgi:hypothetical protein